MHVITFDPRVKAFIFLLSCIYCMNMQNYYGLFAFALFITILLVLSGKVKSAIKMFIVFALGLTAGYIAMNTEANVFTMILGVMATFFKLLMPIIMSFTLVFQTTKISEFLAAFQKIKTPPQVTIPFAVMFRFIPTVSQEWQGIRQAMAFRGIGLTTGKLLFHPIITAEYILVPLLSSCVGIIDELVAASLARGLDSDKKRNCYFTIKMRFYDWVVFVITLGFFALMIWFEFTGGTYGKI